MRLGGAVGDPVDDSSCDDPYRFHILKLHAVTVSNFTPGKDDPIWQASVSTGWLNHHLVFNSIKSDINGQICCT